MGKKTKFIIFVVEGITDEKSLALLLNRILKDHHIRFRIVNGDMTSDLVINTSNIKKKITAEVNNVIRKYHLLPSDVLKIVQLVDTDGAYIDDKYIIDDFQATSPIYTLNSIITNKVESISIRNLNKSRNLNLLCTTTKLKNIPYECYYFSCNLEHVLHNEMNVEYDDKFDKANSFIKTYDGFEDKFLEFMLKSSFCINKSYTESWNFIKQDRNSLGRYTNFNLFLLDILKQL